MAAYAAGLYLRKRWRPVPALSFAGGIAAILVALTSPIDELAEQALLSAHMIQHELLLLVAPALIAWGLTAVLDKPSGARHGAGHPVAGKIAALLMLVNLYVWHWPGLYQAALQSRAVHNAEHLLFLGTGLCFWWHIVGHSPAGISPMEEAWRRLVLLFQTMLVMMPLGLFFLIVPFPVYPLYLGGGHGHTLLSLAAQTKAAVTDQQLGALYMLGGGGAALSGSLLAGLLLMSRRAPAPGPGPEKPRNHLASNSL